MCTDFFFFQLYKAVLGFAVLQNISSLFNFCCSSCSITFSYDPQGQRQRKLEARKQREEKEETERLQIDIEEAKYQAAQRRAAIDKAKTQQYYQTDRVKSFHVSRGFIIKKWIENTTSNTYLCAYPLTLIIGNTISFTVQSRRKVIATNYRY